MDELRAVVERHHAQVLALQRRREGGEAGLDRVDDGLRILAHAQSDDGPDLFTVGVGEQSLAELSAEPDRRDVAEAQARALPGIAAQHDVLHVGDRADEAHATDHGFEAAPFDAHRARVAAGLAQRHHQQVQRQALRREPRRIDVDLVLARDPARRRDLRDARHRPHRRGDELIEQVAFALEVGWALERERVDLAHRRRVRAEARDDAGRQDALHLREPFEHARARRVEVAALVEDHIDVTRAIQRHPAHGLHARQALQLPPEPARDLLVDVGRALPRPLRPDDDLVVAQVGDGVHRHLPPRPQPREAERQRGTKRQERIADEEGQHAGRGLSDS